MEGAPKPASENSADSQESLLNKARMAAAAAGALAAAEGATAQEINVQAGYLDDPGYEVQYERTFDRSGVSEELRDMLPQKFNQQLAESGFQAVDGTLIELQDAGISDEKLAVQVAVYDQHDGDTPKQTLIVELSANSAVVDNGNIVLGSADAAMRDLVSKLKNHKLVVN